MSAKRRAYDAVPETCPTIDSIMDDATAAIKKRVTERFRDALIAAYELVEELEQQVSDLEEEKCDLEKQVSDLESQVSELEGSQTA